MRIRIRTGLQIRILQFSSVFFFKFSPLLLTFWQFTSLFKDKKLPPIKIYKTVQIKDFLIFYFELKDPEPDPNK